MNITSVTYSINAKAETTKPISREQVFALEDAMRRELDPVEMPVTNYFAKSTYGREITIPAGTVLTGKIHKYSSLNVLLSGELLVLTEHGPKRVSAPYVEVSPPGTKRAAFAVTEARWLTIHGTDKTDVAAIEHEFIAQTEQEFLGFCADQLKLKEN